MKHTLRYSLVIVVGALGLAACSVGDVDESESVQSDSVAISPEGRYIIKFNDFSKRSQALAAAGAQVELELGPQNAVAARVPDAAVKGLAANPNVEYVEVDAKRELYGQTTPYGITMVQGDDPAFAGVSGSTKVCIIDSGFYAGHDDLKTLPVSGYTGGPTPWNADGCGHGTHVAGTIAAVNNSTGVVGVAPNNVSLYIVRVFADDCAWTYSSGLVDALNRCESAGSKVVSMSLGGSTSNRTEQTAFQNAYSRGVLSIAAAGNDGNNRTSYPAGYSSVMSVAAIDSNKTVASFSQYNSTVEIAAPGVAVLSTVPWTQPSMTVGQSSYSISTMDGGATKSATGAMVDGGLCDSVGSWTGKVVLCQRGNIDFATKTANVQAGGGVAAVIYNNVAGAFAGTLGTSTSSIPAVSMSMEDGQALVAGSLGQSATVNTLTGVGTGYEAWDGTSMATPHVSGVAALVWSQVPTKTNQEIRDALNATAIDLGAAGRDNYYGNGLVQAKAALDYLTGGGSGGGGTGGGGGGGPTCSAAGASCSLATDCCSGVCSGKGKTKTCQ